MSDRNALEQELEHAEQELLKGIAHSGMMSLIYGYYMCCFFLPFVLPALPFVLGYHLFMMFSTPDETAGDRVERLREQLEP